MNLINKEIYDNLELLPEDSRGWNGKSDFFKRIIDDVKPNLIVEVGSWKGQSAINMGEHIKKINIDCKIMCVDTWLGAIEFWTHLSGTEERNLLLKNGYPQIYYQFLSNVVHHGLQDIIKPFPNTSENGFRYLQSNNINPQMIYIDASHEEDDVYKDIKNYFSVLSKGGVIFGDDYNSWVGVRNASNRFRDEMNIHMDIVEDNFWVIKK
jgi:predicted O-methyltransferase YrrM